MKRSQVKYEIQPLIETLLLEHGEYVPLALLLHEGRLDYRDYEAWRRGEIEQLDAALFGDPAQIRRQLAEAELYLKQRGWQADTLHYGAWNTAGRARTLRFSGDTTLDACFHRRYRKPQDQPQLDLFTDDPAAGVANAITHALADLNVAEAHRLLGRLADLAPDHGRLGGLERLVEAADELDTPVADPHAQLRYLQDTLTPLATDLLGAASRNLLVPLWRRLTHALQAQPFDADEPELHTSYSAAQALDWRGVRDAIEGETGWRTQPILLQRHAIACERQHDPGGALLSWFELCWRFPDQATAIDASLQPEVRAAREAFYDLEPPLSDTSFPAWLLAQRPALSRVMPGPGTDDAACPESYITLYKLVQLGFRSGDGGKDEIDEIELRARLQRQDPHLLRHFLATR